mgnify:CR=1 FL=1
MNVWTVIKDRLEKQTGYRVVSLPDKNDTINVNDLILLITSIERTSHENGYQVRGELAVKAGHMDNWQVVTDLLDLELTGAHAQAHLLTYENGFTAMSINFNILVYRDKNRKFVINEVEYGGFENGD